MSKPPSTSRLLARIADALDRLVVAPTENRTPIVAPPREWLTKREAVAWTGLSLETLSRAKNAGRLSAKKTSSRGGKELYRVSDLRRWLEALEDA